MQTRYKSIFETSLNGIILITELGIIEDINNSALKLFGYEKHELMGQNIKMLLPEPHQSNHIGHLLKNKETEEAKEIGIGRQLDGLKKDKTLFPFQLAVSEFESSGQVFYAGALRDLTEKKMQENIINGYAEELEKRVLDRTKELKQEIRLRESTQKALMDLTRIYQAAAQNFPNGSIYVLNKNLDIIHVEGSDLRQRGINPDDIRGNNFLHGLSNHQRKELETKFFKIFKGESLNVKYTLGDRIYRLRGVLLTNEDNGKILVVENNITKEKKQNKKFLLPLRKNVNLMS